MGRVWILLGIIIWSCQGPKDQQEQESSRGLTYPDTSSIKGLSGEQLAHIYCQKCHLFPEPEQLTKAIWKEGVLPRMAHRLGLKTKRSPFRGLSNYDVHVATRAGIFPSEKKITEEAWQKLEAYYLKNAPDTMASQTVHGVVSPELPFFSVKEVDLEKGFLPLTTLVHYDSTNSRLWIGNAKNRLKVLDRQYNVTGSLVTHSPPVDMVVGDDAEYLLEIGIMPPSDEPEGRLVQLKNLNVKQTLISRLLRPVHLLTTDLNQDGSQDYLISAFGSFTGYLAWYEGDSAENMQKHVLLDDPGAQKTVMHDFNGDGLSDIVTLLAQGDERIIIFYNQGEGIFELEIVLRFPPEYGSSYFELADFNKDGKMDILYANGDNADYSFSLKNYHGIRIFENQGDNTFKEAFFYPLYGATMAKAKDFDQDGDLDIAATAFFTDFERTPEKGFIYLENNLKEEYKFKGYTFPEARKGRWLTFDTGDIDEDGDEDIILGSFGFSPTPAPKEIQEQWENEGADILILKNDLY